MNNVSGFLILCLLPILFFAFLNNFLFIAALFYPHKFKFKYDLNLLYNNIKTRSENPYLLTPKEKEAEIKAARSEMTTLSISFFASLIIRVWQCPLQYFDVLDVFFYWAFLYYLWTMYCLFNIKDDRYNLFPFIRNPITSYKLYKHHSIYLWKCKDIIKRVRYYEDAKEPQYAKLLLDLLSYRFKNNYFNIISKDNLKDNYEWVAVSEILDVTFDILGDPDENENVFYFGEGILDGSSGAYELLAIYNSALYIAIKNNYIEASQAKEERELLKKRISRQGRNKKIVEKQFGDVSFLCSNESFNGVPFLAFPRSYFPRIY